jgi:hypothetical protein
VAAVRPGRSRPLQQRLGHDCLNATEVYLKYLAPEQRVKGLGTAPETGTENGTGVSDERQQNEQALE